MNKKELIDSISAKVNVTKDQVNAVLDALGAVILEEVKQGGEVSVPNLASFKPGERAARTGRNPQTGETMEIAAKKYVKVKAAGAMNKAL